MSVVLSEGQGIEGKGQMGCVILPILHSYPHPSSHPFPATKQQTVTLFGPQLSGSHPFPVPLDSAAPHVTIQKRRGLYHDWVAAQPQEEEAHWRPDMVVAFNSGAHTLDSHERVDGSVWTPTLKLLVAKVGGWMSLRRRRGWGKASNVSVLPHSSVQ